MASDFVKPITERLSIIMFSVLAHMAIVKEIDKLDGSFPGIKFPLLSYGPAQLGTEIT